MYNINMERRCKMFNKTKYWLELCDDDIPVARNLLNSKDWLWMSFICHLIVEKSIKAVIAEITSEEPKRIHDLAKLAGQAGLDGVLSEVQMDFLEELTPYNIEARYPAYKAKMASKLSPDYCKSLMTRTEDFVCWIKQRLGK
jgi:HEPN domain-containing protein